MPLATRRSPVHAIWMVGCVFLADYLTGPTVQFPVLYVVPTAYAAWYGGQFWGYALAAIQPMLRFGLVLWSGAPWSMEIAVVNTVLRSISFMLIAYFVARAADQWHRVRVLEGILSVCSHCKRVHTQGEEWQQMERYITEHSDAQFSHGICPACMAKHYGEFLDTGRP